MLATLLLSAFPAALLAGTGTVAASPLVYTLTDLGTMGGTYNSVQGINDSGQVVGTSTTASGASAAYVWQNGAYTDLGTLGGTDTEANTVSGTGLVAGYSYNAGMTARHAFLWQNGTMRDLGTLGGATETLAFGVDNSGQVVGQTNDGRAFLWQNGVMQDLSSHSGGISPQYAYGINTSGQVVGYAYVPTSPFGHAFLWQNGAITDLGTLGGAFSEARAINDAGQVVGQARLSDGSDHAFLWQNGTMTDLGNLDTSFPNGEAFGINNSSSPTVVGESSYGGAPHAFVWQNGTMTDLNNVVTNLTGWSSLDEAYGVNSSGQIVGEGHLTNGQAHGFLLTPTTAPMAYLHPGGVDFGNQRVGTVDSNTASFSLSNHGNADLVVSSIAVTGASAGDFSQTNTCGAAVAPQAWCVITVSFDPAVPGARSATLTVTDNDASGSQSVSLAGTGVTPILSTSPTSVNFGSTAVGTTVAQTVTLTNSGTDTLNFGSPAVAVSGPNPGDFSTSTTCGATLAVGASCTVSAAFTPTAAGARSATLTVTDDAPGSPQSVTLTGTGTAPAVSLSAQSLGFGSGSVGSTSPPQTVTLTNTGNGPLAISGVSVGGANPGDFSQTNTCGTSVAPGGSCTISVIFSPAASGSRTATLSVADNAPGSPHSVALSGSGLSADVGVKMSASTTSLKTGSSVTYTLTVSNPSGPGAATGVTLVDTLPGNTSLTTESSSCGAPSGGKVTCSLGALGVGSSATVTLTVKSVAYSTTYTNSATVTTATADPNTANNTATVTVQGKH